VSALLGRLPRSLPRIHDRTRSGAIAAAGVLGLATVVTPWYALASYVPNGWDATWWARVALAMAVLAILALRLCRDREAAALLLVALACVAFRVISLPDFGFRFDGIDVPVERRWGLWLALAAAVVALALAAALIRRRPVSSTA
jgi:hypothetical protein